MLPNIVRVLGGVVMRLGCLTQHIDWLVGIRQAVPHGDRIVLMPDDLVVHKVSTPTQPVNNVVRTHHTSLTIRKTKVQAHSRVLLQLWVHGLKEVLDGVERLPHIGSVVESIGPLVLVAAVVVGR